VWIAMWAASLLVMPTLYVMAMIVVWACVPGRGARIAMVSAMALVPLGLAGHAALKAREMGAVEDSFDRICRQTPGPVVHAIASDVDSIFINIRPLVTDAALADRHSQSVFPTETATRFLLQGAVRYPRIERVASWGPVQTIEAGNSARPAESKTAKSRYMIEWRSLQARSKFVTSGTMVVLDSATGQVLGEQSTHYLESPPVTVAGGGDFGFRVFPAKKVACPTARQLIQFVKSVARPAAAPGT
jgi:hypothetical protein